MLECNNCYRYLLQEYSSHFGLCDCIPRGFYAFLIIHYCLIIGCWCTRKENRFAVERRFHNSGIRFGIEISFVKLSNRDLSLKKKKREIFL